MVKDVKHVPALRKELPGVPMIWLQYFGGPTLTEVSDAGCDLVIFPQAAMLLALNAIKEGFTEVLNRGRLESYDVEWMNRGIKKELLGLLGMDAYYELEARTTEGRELS
jgi:2-methylisocitrate lyase-like PEP mutase family enzyme